MSRAAFQCVAAALAAILALTGAALAQDAAGGGGAPTVHTGTKLNFLPSLGGAQLAGSTAYGKAAVSYIYVTPNKMQITVYVFDGGHRVPNGSDNPAVMNHFSEDVDTTERQLKEAGYTQFERPAVPSTCTYGSVAFRCIIYSARSPGGRLSSKMLLTGYHDYFVKIRVDWSMATGQIATDADRALQAFIPALMH